MIDTVLAAAATLAAHRKVKRAETEQRRREAEEAARIRAENERWERLQSKRLEFLTQQMVHLDQAQRIEAFV